MRRTINQFHSNEANYIEYVGIWAKLPAESEGKRHRSPETCGSKLRCVLSSSSAAEAGRNRRKIQEYTGTIQPLLQIYGAIKLFALNREKGLRFEVWNGSGRKVFTDVDQLPMRKLDQISQKEGEEIYFQPAPIPVNGKLCIKAVFLDDVPEEALDHLPSGTVIVQTSPGKYQAHIPLPQPMPIEEAGKIQRALVYYFGSDAASKDLLHLRRLPGFPNKKYPKHPLVIVANIVSSDISVNDILQKVKIEEEQYKNMLNSNLDK